MKTKNNVQKAILKSMVMGLSLVLISLTLNAQDFWKTLMENNSFNVIALAMVDNTVEASPASTDANVFAKYMEEEIEETLDVEEWMTNENNFETFLTIELENENPLELEDWTTNETLFDAYSMYFEIETEEALELEDWMTKATNFSNSTFQIINETENELELENWMISEKMWVI